MKNINENGRSTLTRHPERSEGSCERFFRRCPQNDAEQGRSMIEMLGVLVIAGIITLGGMAGFRTAMNKMRANAIAEAVAEISVEAQTRNSCLEASGLDDFEMPKCVSTIKGASNGQVKVVFEGGAECDTIKELTGASFGKCRWVVEEGYCLFVPNRSSQCRSVDDCSETTCDAYTEASCLS